LQQSTQLLLKDHMRTALLKQQAMQTLSTQEASMASLPAAAAAAAAGVLKTARCANSQALLVI
jgi:hypothetical protein